MRRWALAWVAAALVAPACSRGGGVVESPPAAPADTAADAGSAPTVAAAPAYADLEPDRADDHPDAGTVRIKLVADTRRQAHVFWGRKDLGVAPLEIVRPRGSAPLDLTVVAPDCLPLHTRAFTDRDDTLSLRLYSERDASGLPGYSAPPPSPTGVGKPRRQF